MSFRNDPVCSSGYDKDNDAKDYCKCYNCADGQNADCTDDVWSVLFVTSQENRQGTFELKADDGHKEIQYSGGEDVYAISYRAQESCEEYYGKETKEHHRDATEQGQ